MFSRQSPACVTDKKCVKMFCFIIYGASDSLLTVNDSEKSLRVIFIRSRGFMLEKLPISGL